MEAKEKTDIPKVYFAPPLRDLFTADTNEMYLIGGRGLSKSSGAIAYKYMRNATIMPGSAGFLAQQTYEQGLKRVLPSLTSGWNRLGWIEGEHYVIGRRGPKSWPICIEAPKKLDNSIHLANGTVINIISQDRIGSSNGYNTTWGGGDEAKYLDREQYLEETRPTMRFGRNKWGHLSCYRSQIFTTSMPTSLEDKWLFELGAKMEQDRIDLIFELEKERSEMLTDLSGKNKSQTQKLQADINRLSKALNKLRRLTDDEEDRAEKEGFSHIYYREASTLENIHYLGENYIVSAARELPDFKFRTEILNIRPERQDGEPYYPAFTKDKHTYIPRTDFNHVDQFEYKPLLNTKGEAITDCRWDLDCDKNKPLYIAIDWGVNISAMTIGQMHGNEYTFINEFFVKREGMSELVRKFDDYYHYMNNKSITYMHYNNENQTQVNTNMSYADEFIMRLQSHGWVVLSKPHPMPKRYQARYNLLDRVLREDDPTINIKVRLNRAHCEYTILSVMNALAKQTDAGVAKDKSSERKLTIPQEEATHFSDSFDTHIHFIFDLKVTNSVGFISSK